MSELPQNTAWQRYAADFNAMTDAEIAEEAEQARALLEEQEDWLEAVASWEAAGKPRSTALAKLGEQP
ncbi:hypothetical protein [Tsuneonella sp. HG222]